MLVEAVSSPHACAILALELWEICVTSSPHLSREYVYVASDQRKQRQANREVRRKC
jgi:hypothetical protein